MEMVVNEIRPWSRGLLQVQAAIIPRAAYAAGTNSAMRRGEVSNVLPGNPCVALPGV